MEDVLAVYPRGYADPDYPLVCPGPRPPSSSLPETRLPIPMKRDAPAPAAITSTSATAPPNIFMIVCTARRLGAHVQGHRSP